MGMFGVNLFRNEAHARVELSTAASGNGFIPLAVPDNIIKQAQIRYYRTAVPRTRPLKTVDLHPLRPTTRRFPAPRFGGRLSTTPLAAHRRVSRSTCPSRRRARATTSRSAPRCGSSASIQGLWTSTIRGGARTSPTQTRGSRTVGRVSRTYATSRTTRGRSPGSRRSPSTVDRRATSAPQT